MADTAISRAFDLSSRQVLSIKLPSKLDLMVSERSHLIYLQYNHYDSIWSTNKIYLCMSIKQDLDHYMGGTIKHYEIAWMWND